MGGAPTLMSSLLAICFAPARSFHLLQVTHVNPLHAPAQISRAFSMTVASQQPRLRALSNFRMVYQSRVTGGVPQDGVQDSQTQNSDEYLKHLQLLQRIREVCDSELNLPQICVVGDQSSGKSALLSCVTGISFPVSAGICTRAPIIVQCNNDQNLEQTIFEIQDPISKAYHSVDIDTCMRVCGGIGSRVCFSLFMVSTCYWRGRLCFGRGRDKGFVSYISLFWRVLGWWVCVRLYTRVHTHKLLGYLM